MKFPIKIKFRNATNKKGYYRFADIGMFFLSFLIIAIGVSIGIYLFYSETVDIREREAVILSEKITKVIIKEEHLNQKVLENDFNIFNEAEINIKIINNGDFYFKIEIFSLDNQILKIEEGNRDFEVECNLSGEKFPKCAEKEFNYDYKIKILTASNQK